MLKNKYLFITLFALTHCSIDTKSGLWENKKNIKEEKQLSKIDFSEELTFNEFKNKVILYGKKSKFPNIID